MTMIEIYDVEVGEPIGYISVAEQDVPESLAEFTTPCTVARVVAISNIAYIRQQIQTRRAHYRRLAREGWPPITDTIFTRPPLFASLQHQKGASEDPNDL